MLLKRQMTKSTALKKYNYLRKRLLDFSFSVRMMRDFRVPTNSGEKWEVVLVGTLGRSEQTTCIMDCRKKCENTKTRVKPK